MSNTRNLQDLSLQHGFQYVRAPDDHYLIASVEQMQDFLRDVLGVDIHLPDNEQDALYRARYAGKESEELL